MKKIHLALVAFVALLTLSCQKKTNDFAISFDIAGLEDGSGYVTVFGNKEGCEFTSLDSTGRGVEVKNGHFELAGTTTEPVVVRVWPSDKRLYKMVNGGGYIPVKSCQLWVIVSPGSKFAVKGDIAESDFVSVYPAGDKENKILAELNSKMMPLINEDGNLSVQAANGGEVNAERSQAIEKELDALRRAFVAEHPSSIAALWLMEDMLIRSQIETEALEEPLSKVDSKYHENYFYKTTYGRVEGAKATAVGQPCPRIVGVTPEGEEFNIESLRGKYLLIDFWGTWCGACIAGMPDMKAFRDAHADKLQIVGVAQGGTEEQWKSFISEHGIDWPNIRSGKGADDFVAACNVQGFPTKILISPDGIILHRATGEGEEYYQQLEALIK